MPKTKVNYDNRINLNTSGQFLNYIQMVRRHPILRQKFGRVLTNTELLRHLIYEWIVENEPSIIINDLEAHNVPEIKELKSIKENHLRELQESMEYTKWHFENRKKFEPTKSESENEATR